MDTLSSAILGAVKEGAVTRLLRPFSNASSRQNEALLMLKPECFLGGEPEAVLQLIFRKLEAFGVELDATLVMEGPVLERLGIIDRHYRQAAAFSRQASSLVTPPERSQMAQLCGLDGPVLGGHEWLALHPQTSAEALDAAWFAQKPRKLRSGFYAVPFQSQDRPCLLVNGFYPAQAAHFT
ncbi:MAG: hypothetical protein LWX11_08865, partial [Firmicutes bacterium]|nr:hypothetical protein [Bacillota bacterium]